MTKSISTFYCFPRSGGTLLSQCLLCSPQNIVLSEINPAISVIPPEVQAADWFQLFDKKFADEIRFLPYLARLAVIADAAAAREQRLCVRDWSGVNFLEKISPWHGQPSRQLEQHIYLSRAGYEIRAVALVRRSRAVYDSMRTNIPELADLSLEDFDRAYRAYLLALRTVRKFHLEQLLGQQTETLQEICTSLQLDFAADFSERFHSIQTVTGNNSLARPAASASWTTLRSPAKAGKRIRAKKAQENLFAELDDLAGYASE